MHEVNNNRTKLDNDIFIQQDEVNNDDAFNALDGDDLFNDLLNENKPPALEAAPIP